MTSQEDFLCIYQILYQYIAEISEILLSADIYNSISMFKKSTIETTYSSTYSVYWPNIVSKRLCIILNLS